MKKLSKKMVSEQKRLKKEIDEKLLQIADGAGSDSRNEYYKAKENLFYWVTEKHVEGYEV
jgi:hypothetical protein|tara:strand:- start:881 stop:1060 length:180 start_codon:yes stop_codon:yes gene_type:complete